MQAHYYLRVNSGQVTSLSEPSCAESVKAVNDSPKGLQLLEWLSHEGAAALTSAV